MNPPNIEGYRAYPKGHTEDVATGVKNPIWTVYGPKDQTYGLYRGSYTQVVPDRSGKMRLRHLPARCYKVKAYIDAAIAAAEKEKESA